MATATGTASNYLDLLTKLRDFLVAQGWTQVGGKATGAIDANADFVSVMGPGLSGDDQIYVSLQPYSVPANNAYALRVRGHTAYVNAGTSQPGADSNWCYLLALNSPLTYWFVVNGRRFIVICKSGSRYDAMYAGFILPEHLPSDWSYPMLIGASSYNGDVAQASDAPWHSNFWNPVAGSDSGSNTQLTGTFIFSPIQAWVPMRNGYLSGGDSTVYVTTGRQTVPWTRNANQNVRRQLDDAPYFRRGQLAAFARSGTGSPDTGLPEGGQFYGSFDGVFYTPAFGATAEQESIVDGKTYKMFPNVGRTADGHFAAIVME